MFHDNFRFLLRTKSFKKKISVNSSVKKINIFIKHVNSLIIYFKNIDRVPYIIRSDKFLEKSFLWYFHISISGVNYTMISVNGK